MQKPAKKRAFCLLYKISIAYKYKLYVMISVNLNQVSMSSGEALCQPTPTK